MNKQQLPQDAQFSQPYPPYQYRDDEISLIDLAKILVRRRNWMFATFIAVFSASLLVAWLKRPQPVDNSKVAFTTLFAVGYKTPTVFIEPLSSIKTQLESAFIPVASEGKPFSARVEIENRRNVSEDGNNIVKLITLASLDQKEQVAAYHNAITEPLLARHNQLAELLQEQLMSSAEVSKSIQPLNSSVASSAQPLPLSPQKDKSKLIVAAGIFLASILAIMMAFIREFLGRLRSSLND
ncbi:hypothetical protein [Zobellella sp. An-6]|uniref:hypothetical protein n=1 Tax=Zobellella sp. An-6 TaxID=3400218 RepID=UPI004043265F